MNGSLLLECSQTVDVEVFWCAPSRKCDKTVFKYGTTVGEMWEVVSLDVLAETRNTFRKYCVTLLKTGLTDLKFEEILLQSVEYQRTHLSQFA